MLGWCRKDAFMAFEIREVEFAGPASGDFSVKWAKRQDSGHTDIVHIENEGKVTFGVTQNIKCTFLIKETDGKIKPTAIIIMLMNGEDEYAKGSFNISELFADQSNSDLNVQLKSSQDDTVQHVLRGTVTFTECSLDESSPPVSPGSKKNRRSLVAGSDMVEQNLTVLAKQTEELALQEEKKKAEEQKRLKESEARLAEREAQIKREEEERRAREEQERIKKEEIERQRREEEDMLDAEMEKQREERRRSRSFKSSMSDEMLKKKALEEAEAARLQAEEEARQHLLLEQQRQEEELARQREEEEKQKQIELEKQKQLEMEKQKQLELERQKEQEKQKELEQQREKEELSRKQNMQIHQDLIARSKYSFKTIVIGDSGVGKSSYISKCIDTGNRPVNTSTTVACNMYSIPLQTEKGVVTLNVWDTAGQEQYKSITKTYFRDVDCAIAMFDITSKESFDNIGQWIQELNSMNRVQPLIVLIGNKSDMQEEREVSIDEAAQYAESIHSSYFETSTNTGTNIKESVYTLSLRVNDVVEQDTINKPMHVTPERSNDRGKKKCC